jgi:hypothetical protein
MAFHSRICYYVNAQVRNFLPGADLTIVSYNARAVKIYNATSYLNNAGVVIVN